MLTGERSASEAAVQVAFPRGGWVDLRGEAEREVRAEVLVALLLGAYQPEPGFAAALRLRGALITGCLDLTGADVQHTVVFEHCEFEQELRLVEARTRTIHIDSCRMPSFDGARMRVDGRLHLGASVIEDLLRLDRARIVGELSLRGASVGNDPDGTAVSAHGIVVEGMLNCGDGFVCHGSFEMRGARIDQLEFADATLDCPHGRSLRAPLIKVSGSIRAHRLVSKGEFQIGDGEIAGSLNCTGASFSNPGGIALSAGGVSIGGRAWCTSGFSAEGEVRFIGAKLSASFDAAKLSNPGGDALNFAQAELRDFDGAEMQVDGGAVRFVNARIATSLMLDRARFNAGIGSTALSVEGAFVDGTVFLIEATAVGEVRLRTSHIAGRVLMMRSTLENDDVALRMSRAEVAADVFCDGMRATGLVKLTGAKVASVISFDRAVLRNPGKVALDLELARANILRLGSGASIDGVLLLQHAVVGLLADDKASWPAEIRLDGFIYNTLEPPLPAADRLRWLRSDLKGYRPQPYEQLSAYYEARGQMGQAGRVQHAKERQHRAALTPLGRFWSYLQDVTIAYGYQPWRAMFWLTLLLTIGSVVYAISPPPVLGNNGSPHFNSVIYTLDLLLPIVDLGQKHAFNPSGGEQWLSYLLMAAGWLLATTIAAAVARVVTRR